jgi:hypothetical protein
MRILFLLFFIGVLALPGDVIAQGLVTCQGTECDVCDLADMTNNIIQWLFGFLTLCAVLVFAIAGFKLVTSGGDTSAREWAKERLTYVVIGFLLMFASWLIVDTILKGFTGTGLEVWGTFDVTECGEQRNLQFNANAPGTAIAGPDAMFDLNEVSDAPGAVNLSTLPGYSGGRGSLPVVSQVAGSITYANGARLQAYTLNTSQAPYDYSACPSATPPQFFNISESGNVQIARNFTVCQLTNCNASQRAGEYAYLDPRAVAGMDRVADMMGGTPRVNSGYRSPSYNDGVEGATCSQHMTGKAFDIAASGQFTTAVIEQICRDAGAGWTRQYATFTHCDWR